MKRVFWGLGALALAAASMPMEADAQDRRTRERLQRIEQQLQDLQGTVYGADGESGAPVRFQGANPEGSAGGPTVLSADTNADFLVRLGSVEQELQRLTGEMERLNFQMRQQQEQMQRLVSLAYPEYEGDIGLGVASSPSAGIEGGSLEPVGGPVDLVGGGADAGGTTTGYASAEAAYAAGRSALLEARYADAERAFLAVTEDFPDSERAGDATYYLGETYLAQGDLGAAARTFLDFIRNHPENDRAADAHLKLGQAFARADKTTEACRVWQRGLQQYSDMDATLRQRMVALREATCN